MFNLGVCFEFGQGVRQCGATALRWYRRASRRGHTRAAFQLSHAFWWARLGLQRDPRRAVRWFHRAAGLGEPESMGDLGIAHHEGLGVRKDLEGSARWSRRARAAEGRGLAPRARHALQDGEGVRRNPTRARNLMAAARRVGAAEARG
jgi:TPR repeat protein